MLFNIIVICRLDTVNPELVKYLSDCKSIELCIVYKSCSYEHNITPYQNYGINFGV